MKARLLIFALAFFIFLSACAGPPPALRRYQIQYPDGRTEIVEMRYCFASEVEQGGFNLYCGDAKLNDFRAYVVRYQELTTTENSR